jgi:transcriptional regulator of heat shock response
MNERQSRLLAAIIDQFIDTALPVGSKRLLESAHFPVSSATIRSEMMTLEDEGFLVQPHVSAGRIPTAAGYRMYVREFMQPTKEERAVQRKFETLKEQYFRRKDQERVYEAVSLLAQMIPNVSFATVPHRDQVFYMGFSNILRQPEFEQDAHLARFVAEVLETKLAHTLQEIAIDEKVRYYIGEEHLLHELQSCSMMVTSYALRGSEGVIGILGPMRMDYAYNTVALELVADLLRS